MRLTRGCGLGPVIGSNTTGWIDPSQSQFAGQHEPIRAGSRDNDVNHLAGFRVACRSLRGPINIVGPYRRDAEFGGDGVDRLLCDIEVGLTIGGEIRGDVALVVLLRFITRQPIEKRGDVVDGQGRFSAIVRRARWLARTSACSAGLSSGMWAGSTATPTVGIWK